MENEKLYFSPQSTQIAGQTGLIGILRADCGKNEHDFWTEWTDVRHYLKTDEFKKELSGLIKSLRFSEAAPLGSRDNLNKFVRENTELIVLDEGWFGYRIDTETYSYLLKMRDTDKYYSVVYAYCYKKDWLNGHIRNSERGIRFITSDYETKFILPDGGKIKITESDGETSERICRYVDEYHLETSASKSTGWNLWHICEFAERMEQNGNTVEPITDTIRLINARYYCPLTMSVRNCTYDGRYARQHEGDIREALEREHSYDRCDEKSMATYQNNPKIRSVRFDVKDVNGTMYGCIRVGLAAPLTASEEKDFKSWLSGQCSDGFGEGFEQRELYIEDSIGHLSFWNSGKNWFMKNENEFRDYLNQNNTIKMEGM